ncbi:MAG: FAD-dependent oxidoreductase [Desulfobacteraceae bacterium]|nr:MAG: FAD-dependent oxidoreductase [Desulfobacteraceae bacterium]
MEKKIGSALVVGSGIGGIRSALDLAEVGYHVTLIDKAPHIGGVLSRLDYQFPTDHCGMCKMLPLVDRDSSSQFCLRKGLFHENIDILLSTELVHLEGEPGKYKATVRRKPTLVDPTLCVGCGECSRVCPVEVPDSFNAGLTTRKAVYLPVPHNIPNTYMVDLSACTLCGECEKVCPTRAIDFGKEARAAFKILVVDDELVIRDSLKEWLEDEGFRIDVAESGSEALDKISKEPFRLMLLDIKMPGMDGVEVLKRAKSLNPDLTVVMMTAYATVETAVEAMKIGAMDYLMKPFDPDTLIPLILQLHQGIEKSGEQVLDVGALVLSTGFDSFDPSTGPNTYGYGVLPGVVTSVEFERMVSSTGATGGRMIRPSDGKEIGKIAWLQCVGSREPKEKADFCSSACCMFSVKEALLAKSRSDGRIEASIFYMDMRTFGKDFQRYRDEAEKVQGVRFIRSRVHSIQPIAKSGALKVVYADSSGNRREESYDLVVLASGMRPPGSLQSLVETTGIELNPSGFCSSSGFFPARTSREGIYAGGSFSGLRDISESVIQASSAALEASRLIRSKGGGLGVQEKTPAPFRDVSREIPSSFVALCGCGGTMGKAVDLEGIEEWLKVKTEVKEVAIIDRICTREGWETLRNVLKKSTANRVLISACMPYLYNRKLLNLGEAAGLPPSLIDVVDMRTAAFSAKEEGREKLTPVVRSAISMSMSRLAGLDPAVLPGRKGVRKALVVGGGIAGMTAALSIADHGYPVSLVEKRQELGGNLGSLYSSLEDASPRDLLQETMSRIEKHPNIRVFRSAAVLHSSGEVGRFATVIQQGSGPGETIDHGVTILATGGSEAKTTSYGYGQSKAVLTQHELEQGLFDKSIDPAALGTVAMIQCVDSREEPRNYCSRICCSTALKNALTLKEQNPGMDVFIFYRDLMAYGFLESFYTKARQKGVVFLRYDPDRKPEVRIEHSMPVITAADHILERSITVKPDLLVLSTGIVPDNAKEVGDLFGVKVNRDGFFQEAESKWRPTDFLREGIFSAGIAHSPRSVKESIAMAQAAAQRSLRILSQERLFSGVVVAEVRHALCSRCERCIDACPYEARRHDEELDRIVVDELMCQGCGSCAAVCPNSAAVVKGCRDQHVLGQVEAALA